MARTTSPLSSSATRRPTLVSPAGETLRNWGAQAQIDGGLRPGTTTSDAQRIAELQRENRELRRANEILKTASILFAGSVCPARRGGAVT